jgi:membrane protease YdiL (CAAX protease family)
MSATEVEGVQRLPLGWAASMTLVAGAVGWLTDRAAVHAGSRFPSGGYLIGELVWKAWTFAVLIWVLRRLGHGPVSLESLGLKKDRAQPREPFPFVLAVLVGAGAVALSMTVGSSATSSNSYGGSHHVGVGLAIAEIVVRYPLTVLVEEAFFRGFMQPRLGRNGPVFSALLWGLYHLQQASTIPSIVVFGLILGLIRWWTRTVRVTGTLHYLSNAAFFVGNYL